MNPAQRILIRLPNWLGDLLLARPMLHALRRSRPGAVLRGVGPGPLLATIEHDGVLDHVEPLGRDRSGVEALIARIRAWRPEAALVLPPSFSSAWFAFRCGAPVRIGYRHEGREFLLTERPPRGPRGDLHLSEEYMRLARRLGARPGDVPSLPVSPRAREDAARLLHAAGVASCSRMVLGPGGTYGPAKRWPAERFAELGRLARRRGSAVLVCGAPAETEICDAVAASIGEGAVSLAGRTDLPAQAATCADAQVAVCNDSGLAHLAAAVGTPTIALFGSTSSAWTAPLGARVRVLQHAPVCSPCFRRTCAIGYRCLDAIGVGEVDRVVRELTA